MIGFSLSSQIYLDMLLSFLLLRASVSWFSMKKTVLLHFERSNCARKKERKKEREREVSLNRDVVKVGDLSECT